MKFFITLNQENVKRPFLTRTVKKIFCFERVWERITAVSLHVCELIFADCARFAGSLSH